MENPHFNTRAFFYFSFQIKFRISLPLDNNQQNEIPDNNLFHEPNNRFKGLFLFLVSFFMVFIIIMFTSKMGYQNVTEKEYEAKPFLDVTNRDMSVFLWQFPEFMRSNVKRKGGYLPAFEYIDTELVNPYAADQIVIAPPELLFLFHTWSRLLSDKLILRPIIASEFLEFLEKDKQWQPQFWKGAPKDYGKFVESLPIRLGDDLQAESVAVFPHNVRQAFGGWKNYFKEGALINVLQPTYKQVEVFLVGHPHYARNFWRNISQVEGISVAGLRYLESLQVNDMVNLDKENEPVPISEISTFLRVALYNFFQAEGLKIE